MSKASRTALIVVATILLLAFGAYFYIKFGTHGFSARAQPSDMEKMMAQYARDTAMPASARTMKNPVVLTPTIEHETMAHFADHCAICHGNDGSGQTMFGKGLYPKPPDLRGETQQMSDGEIFYDIENGIRMSGMPAFGGSDSADASWKLVLFIRHLPKLTTAEESEMESLNPKSPEEFKEEQQEEQFLNGGDSPAATATPHQPGGHHQ